MKIETYMYKHISGGQVSNEKRKEEVVWLASESLPSGWKMRNPPGRFQMKLFSETSSEFITSTASEF